MKTLPQVVATAEQLPLISQNRFGVEVICGAAGSGKTSTALLRLRSLCLMFAARHARRDDVEPVRVLVLTFNRTLAGYVRHLAEHQIATNQRVRLEIETFGRWAMSMLDWPSVDSTRAEAQLRRLARRSGILSVDYVVKEVDYLLGRFAPHDIEQYVTTERTGRGALPRVIGPLRRRLLDEVVYPYLTYLDTNNLDDWNSVALKMVSDVNPVGYDIVIVDESQDFSANQLRAVRHHLSADHAVTFVIDTVQRIYARGFTWLEAGYDVRPERVHTLHANHRNTVEIARFASGVLNGIRVDGDGALPNLDAAMEHGNLPQVVCGLYQSQVDWAIRFIRENVDLTRESVAFLKPRGGQWFGLLRSCLHEAGIEFVEITREADWPEGSENVALCTFHSAKGLEFDHVIILGLSDINTPFADAELDDEVFVLRRLLAVAIARARRSVTIGYKPGEESRLIEFFANDTFRQLTV